MVLPAGPRDTTAASYTWAIRRVLLSNDPMIMQARADA